MRRGLPIIEQTAGQTKVPVFAVGLSSDSQQILQAIRKGAREYLHEDDLQTELLGALGKLQQTGAAPVQWGKIIAVTGAMPGIGVTTVACNVGFALAATYPGRVVLAELGGGVPELALDLDLKPPHSLADLVAGWDRIDATLMRRALVEHSGRLSVLAYPPETLQPVLLEPPAMRQMLAILRSMFAFTIIDLGHDIDPTHLEAINLADKVVLVVRLDVPSVRLSRQFFHQLEELGVARAKLHVAANRYGQRRTVSVEEGARGSGAAHCRMDSRRPRLHQSGTEPGPAAHCHRQPSLDHAQLRRPGRAAQRQGGEPRANGSAVASRWFSAACGLAL